MKILIIPGNGDSMIESDHWYAWVRDQLRAKGFKVVAQNMPDPIEAKKSVWLPFIKEDLHANEETIVIGHSSGAVAALSLLEEIKVLGVIIIGCNYTDLGYEDEKKSGYYDGSWKWKTIKSNAKWIVQFASQDDPYIPIKEPRFIHEQLDSEYHEYVDRGHFGSQYKTEKEFPEVVEVIVRKTTVRNSS